MEKIIGQKVRIVKVSDDVFHGSHPNGINEGYTVEGTLQKVNPYILVEQDLGRCFWTSDVKSTDKIDETHYTVKTNNSTYSVEVI